jgi:hypothetical protein
MDSTFVPLLVFLGISLLCFGAVGWWLAKNVREQVEEALRETAGDDEAQAEIRKKVVKALFPPRFGD